MAFCRKLFALLLASPALASCLVVPVRSGASVLHARTDAASVLPSSRCGMAAMQVQAPVKIPDVVLQPGEGKPSMDDKSDKGKKFKLLLFNDNVNRREYVAKILVSTVPGLSQSDAYAVMQMAHKSGMAVVGVYVFELCEAYCDQLKAGGLIASVTAED